MSFETPIAFILYNRPDLTRRVFSEIALMRPRRLYLIADGPKREQDIGKCLEARRIVEQIDWDCQCFTNFSAINLGCRNRVSSGLDWVFDNEERAIIIEDDCLPDPSFFGYCEALLDRYAEDERIMHIAGGNFLFESNAIRDSYYFSRYSFVWGWATWRRAWNHYDVDMASWPVATESGWLESYFEDPIERDYWCGILDRTWRGEIDTWDFQWYYSCWVRQGLSIAPATNLISNLGFRPDATHTNTALENVRLANMAIGPLGQLRHPQSVSRDMAADQISFRNFYHGERGSQPVEPVPFRRYLINALQRRMAWLRSR